MKRNDGAYFRTTVAAKRFLGAVFLAYGIVFSGPAPAANQGVIVVVNDQPITSFDVEQHIKMTTLIGNGKHLTQKEAVEDLINAVLKRAEAKRLNALLSDDQIDKAVERLAKGSGTTMDGLTAKLKSVGISMKALRDQLMTSLSFNRVLISKYQLKATADDAAVDKKLAALKQDPRMKPIGVYELIEVVLPVEKTGDAMESQLLVSRAVEAHQIQSRFKGCNSVHDAAEGIFNVKVSKTLDAPPDKLPQPLRAALDKAGPGSLVGPMRSTEGVQLIGFCGRRTISPPTISREDAGKMVVEEMYNVYEEKYLRDLRRTALIDYKDPSLAQDPTQ